jgi:hypothetical protein
LDERDELRAVARGWLLLKLRRRWLRAQAAKRRGMRVAAWMAAHLRR